MHWRGLRNNLDGRALRCTICCAKPRSGNCNCYGGGRCHKIRESIGHSYPGYRSDGRSRNSSGPRGKQAAIHSNGDWHGEHYRVVDRGRQRLQRCGLWNNLN